MIFKNSIDLYKKAVELIPGGVNSPVRAFKSVNREAPIFIKKGQGAKLWDEDDNEYIDEWIKDTMIDLINDKEKHRDVTGTIEITKELGIIDNKDYKYLMGKYNEVKDIKKELSLLNIDTGPMQ